MQQFHFSTISFVPSATRDDRLSLAVVVVDAGGGRFAMKVTRGVRSKLRAVDGAVDPARIEDLLEAVRTDLDRSRPNFLGDWLVPIDLLERMHRTWVNQIQVTSPRPFRAPSLEAATEQLAAMHVGGSAYRSREGRTRRAVRRTIKATITGWELGPYRLEEQRIQRGPDKVLHQADFWLVNGKVDAALYAFAPDSELNAIVLRDSMPTVLETFRANNEGFQVVAVTTVNPSDEFVEAGEYLKTRGIVVATTEQLDALRPRLLPQSLI